MSVKWNGDDLILLIQEGLNISLDEIAFRVIARGQHNIVSNGQVDTSNMLNSGYIVSPNQNTYVSRKKRVPARTAGEGEAVAGFSVEYALAQEVRKPFFYPAVEVVAGETAGILKKNIKL